MPPSFRVPPRAGAAVGLLAAVILGLLIGGVAGVALHERSEDDDTAAPTTTSSTTSSTGTATSPTTTARGGAEPTLAHTGAPADLLLLLGLAAGGVGLATRRTGTCARRG